MSRIAGASAKRRRGQPIVVLAALLLLWAIGRAALWESPFAGSSPIFELPGYVAPAPAALPRSVEAATPDWPAGSRSREYPTFHSAQSADVYALADLYRAGVNISLREREKDTALQAMPKSLRYPATIPNERSRPSRPGSEFVQHPPVLTGADQRQTAKRWSLDSWLFIRQGGQRDVTIGPAPATYGASQAGAVLRYRLAPHSGNRPAVYLRVNSPLAQTAEAEIASGLAARPIASLPLAAHGEVRVSRPNGKVRARPAAFVVTELPRVRLPLQSRLEAYAQAGYVGGDFATGFVDGHLRLDREAVAFDLGSLRLGGGVWGGAQKGAARLDAGPTASLDIKIGETPARISMDYRHRLTGDAEPQSGVAITISSGF
ncbi:hypothetical protein [Pontixanthobacter aquaemixtae]|uniref:Uncharacterized protein n=1 Tax=Pontixanthobacter aquaemixtae TaxID=1958940 RepID=A0A844ZR05_9SPHN|nr:hypothetical protein [Pontixanthobacter aquaemixtae]MXO89446.1 hypothetical protein [Pontixanthobacter aquaemixtae]